MVSTWDIVINTAFREKIYLMMSLLQYTMLIFCYYQQWLVTE